MIKKFFLILSIITTSIVICACGCGSTKETNTETQTTTIFEAEQTTEVPTSAEISETTSIVIKETTTLIPTLVETEATMSEETETLTIQATTEEPTTTPAPTPIETEAPRNDTWVRNTELEQKLFNDNSRDYTNIVEREVFYDEYARFSPEQYTTFDSICEQYVAGNITADQTRQRLVDAKIVAPSGNVKTIMGDYCNVTKTTFSGKDISSAEFNRTMQSQNPTIVFGVAPNYLFVRVFYNEARNETIVYLIKAEGCFNS